MAKRNRYINTVHPQSFNSRKPQAIAVPLPHGKPLFERAMLYTAMAIILLLTFMHSATAQPTVLINTPEANKLYSQLLDDPTNRSLNLRYSTAMSKGGDYEAAIAPLERLLVSEPQDAWLMLQLGRLYHALGSKSTAATYLYKATNESTASAETIRKAKQLLSNM